MILMAVTTAPNRKNTPRAMTIRPMKVAASLTAGNYRPRWVAYVSWLLYTPPTAAQTVSQRRGRGNRVESVVRSIVREVARETVADGIPLPQWQEDRIVKRVVDGVACEMIEHLKLERRLMAIEAALGSLGAAAQPSLPVPAEAVSLHAVSPLPPG
jgi:hypothetical protein